MAGIAFIQALPYSSLNFSLNDYDDTLFLLLKVILCMVFLRSSAMGFNRLIDRKFDALNPRTVIREIPSGKLSPSAVGLFVSICALVFIGIAWSINLLTGILSLPLLLLLYAYSYTKRFSYISHFFLGLSIGLCPSATWIAVLGRIDLLPVLWSLGLMFYIAGFDILYSCQDYEFDRKAGLFSLPSYFGIGPSLWISRICHVLALGLFILAGLEAHSGIVFYSSIIFTGLLFLLEHFLVWPRQQENEEICFEKIPIAFFHINASISTVLFLGVFIEQWFFKMY